MKRSIFLLLILGGLIFSCGKKTTAPMADQPKVEQNDPDSIVLTQEAILEAVTEEYEEGEPEPVYLLCELVRSTCYGKCPAYHIKLYSDGIVTYDGKANVERLGKYAAYCEPESFEAIFTAAEEADYFVLRSQYPEDGRQLSDIPNTITYLKREGLEKRIIDNFDAPSNLVNFEKWLDAFFDELDWTQEK